jgi:hypothetical protein
VWGAGRLFGGEGGEGVKERGRGGSSERRYIKERKKPKQTRRERQQERDSRETNKLVQNSIVELTFSRNI